MTRVLSLLSRCCQPSEAGQQKPQVSHNRLYISISTLLCSNLYQSLISPCRNSVFKFLGSIQMVCFHCSIAVDQQIIMSKSVNSTELSSKLRNKKSPNSPNHLSIPDCQQSRSAAIDVVIFISVICACGFLLFSLFPYIKLLISNTIEIFGEVAYLFREEVIRTPWVYGCFGLSILCAVTAMLAITVCTFTKCGKPGCRGLRNAAEFDIQIETEECVKNLAKDVMKRGLFELPRDHHRELEAELKKMAPPNGRAVLVFRSRCGCSVGRMEVPGPKKLRKVKK